MMTATSRLWLLLLVAGACVLAVHGGRPKYTPQCPLLGMPSNLKSGCILCNRNRVCVDFDSDPKNCGSCFRTCSSNQFCLNGLCVAGQATPASPSPTPGGIPGISSPSPRPSHSPSPSPATCTAIGGQCAATINCCGMSCCVNNVCVSSSNNPANCGPSCSACGLGQSCIFGLCQSSGGQTTQTNIDLRGFSTCNASDTSTTPPPPINVVNLCTENWPTTTSGVILNITRANFAALNILPGSCMSVSLCEMNNDTSVGGASSNSFVDLSWAPPLGLNTTLTTCGASNCNSTSATLLSRINVLNTNQSEEIVNIISRSGSCLYNLGVRLTVSPDCIRFGGPQIISGGGLPLPLPIGH